MSSVSPYSIKIYRKGYFVGGGTERSMTQVGGLFPATGALPIGRTAYRDGANWPAAVIFTLPNYSSGFYVVRLEDTATPPNTVDVPFMMRSPTPSKSKILLVTADVTFTAYNDWGGRSVYGYADAADDGTRALHAGWPSATAARIPFGFNLSFQRPVGYAQFNSSDESDLPFLTWLGRQGIPVDVSTSRDLHFAAPSASNYRLVLFVGHHEYWTREMRDNVEAFARAGGNVGIFSGNTCWWQVRLSNDGENMECYKIKGFDYVALSNPPYTSVNWWDDPVFRPETSMTGLSFYDSGQGSGFFDDQSHRFSVVNQSHWALANTGLVLGQEFGDYVDGSDVKSVVGNEIDRFEPGGPTLPPGMQSPSNFARAASVYADPVHNQGEIGTMGSFVMLPGTGEVFNAGTVHWALGLADPSPSNKISRITLNVINRLGPGLHQSSPGPVSGLSVSKTGGLLRLDWTSVEAVAGPGTEYDVARGLLSTLRSNGLPASASCAANAVAGSPYTEGMSDCPTSQGNGCWYLVRAKNSVGLGTYGAAALDASAPCPP